MKKKNLVLIDVSGSSLYHAERKRNGKTLKVDTVMPQFIAPLVRWINSNCPEVHSAENDVRFIGSSRNLVSLSQFEEKFLNATDGEKKYSIVFGGSTTGNRFKDYVFPELQEYQTILFVTDIDYPYNLVEDIFSVASANGVERLVLLPIIKSELFSSKVYS